MKKYFTTATKIQNDDYPYGRERATVFFSLEFKKGKGFRSVFQSINPKNGRLNAPKYSTYSPVVFMYEDTAGHIKYAHYDGNGAEDFNELSVLLAEHYALFTDFEMSCIYMHMIGMLKVHAVVTAQYKGADIKEVLAVLDNPMKELLRGYSGHINTWAGVTIDEPAIVALHQPDFNPFKRSEPVSLMSMVK